MSWELLEQKLDIKKGAVSSEFGFMQDPAAMNRAPIALPDTWVYLYRNLKNLYADQSLRAYCDQALVPWAESDIQKLAAQDPLGFMKTKSIVFCMVQAWVDCGRVISKEMQEPPEIPAVLSNPMRVFSTLCHSPDYCTLADMSLTAPVLKTPQVDLGTCTFDDFRLICPVFSATQEAGHPFEVLSGTGLSEQRFHNTPTMMEFRTASLVARFAEVQQKLAAIERISDPSGRWRQDRIREGETLMQQILEGLRGSIQIVHRLFEGFSMLSKDTVDPVDWHQNIVKYTSGYHGNLGMSGPQTPCIHLLDAFLGRRQYDSELGQTTAKVFGQIQSNHRLFIKAISGGPSIRDYVHAWAKHHGHHPLVDAYNELLDAYCQGFLAVHKARAMEFALKGFSEAGPREFTAETTYSWPAPRNVVDKLRTLFDDSRNERQSLRVSTEGR